MLRTAPRALGSLAVLACAGLVATCTNEAAGPGRRAAFAVEPVFPQTLHLVAFNLTIDNVRLIVVRPPSDTVYDQTAPFPANQSTLQLSADIPLNTSPESFDVTIQMLSGSTLLFSGTQSVAISEGSNTTPAQIPLVYSGPGQNIATLTLGPQDSLLTWDGSLAFRPTALDGQQNPVTSYYLSWTTNDAAVPIDPTGSITAPHFRKTVTVTATTPTNVSASTTLTLLPAASAITIVSGCGQTAAPGSQLPQPIVVKVVATDNGGVQGIPVTFTPPAGAVVAQATVVTDANGLAQTLVTLGPTPGPAPFSVSAPKLTTVTCGQTVSGATRLAFTTQPTSVAVGSPISPPVAVTALDAFNNPATTFTGNVTIALGTNPAGATLGGTVTVAAVAGVATFNDLTLDKLGSGFTLSAASSGLPTATSAAFNIVNTGGTHLVFTTQPTNVVAGAPITPAVVVTAEDALNNPVMTFTASVTLALGTCPGATLGGTATVAAVAGVASFPGLSVDKAGPCNLVASASGQQSVASGGFTVSASAAAKLAFTLEPTTVAAGVVIAPPVTVAIEDAFGNIVPLATDNVTMAIGTNSGGATLGGTKTVAAVAGVATFPDLTLDKTGTSYTLTAASGALTGTTSTAFDVANAGGAHLVFTTQPSGVTAGVAIAPPVVVTVEDALNNVVTSFNANVTIALGTCPVGAILGGTATVAATGGVATFSGLSVDKVGACTLVASAPLLSSVASASFSVGVGAPAQLVFTVQPSAVVPLVPIAPAVVVTVEDAAGNIVPTATTAITVAVGTNPGAAALGGTKTVNAVAGLATFADLTLDKAATGYTLTAAASGLTGATSATFDVNAVTGTHLVFSVQPSNVVAGVAIAPAVVVEALDGQNAVIPSFTATVTLSLGTCPGGASLGGTVTVAATAGVATFGTLTVNRAGSCDLVAASSGLPNVSSAAFTVGAAAAAKLAFTVEPTTAAAGSVIAPAVAVTIEDGFGNPVPTATGNVTIAIGSNPGGATLGGTKTVGATAGLATFSDLTFDKTGTGYTLTAASGSLTGTTSAPFNVLNAGGTHLVFAAQPSDVVAGVAFAPAVVVTAEDALNNIVTSFAANVTLSLGTCPGGATLGGAATVAATAGVATFNTLTVDKAGSCTLVASSAPLTDVTSSPFTVSVAGPAQLAFAVEPTPVAAGSMIAPAVAVTIEDAFGNPTTASDNVTIAIGTNPGGATLGGTKTVGAVAGLATFSDLTLDKTGTGYTLTAASGVLTGTTSTTFDVTNAGGTHLVFTTPPANVTAGVAIAPAVVVTARDALNNVVTSFTSTVTIALGTCPIGASLGGTASVIASAGVATFNTLTVDKAGSCTLSASAASLSSVTSGSFTVSAAAATSVVKISGDNQNGTGGQPLAQPLVVEVRDAFANPVSGATVSWATPDLGSLAPASGPTGSNGQAQSVWTLGASATGQTATATVGALPPASFSATATILTPAITLSFAGIPGVGIGLSSKVYVDINQPAPAGGTTITLVSGDPTIFTVAPQSLTIPQGKTRDSVSVTGVAAGQKILTASSSGFTDGTLTVVVQNRNISVPPTLNVPYGQTASLPIQLPAPAPAGGVSFTVVSAAPGFVSVASSPVTIAAGGQTVNATLNGVLPGPAAITVSNPAYVDGVTTATTTASLDITQTSTSLNASFGTSISINFVSNGVPAAAPAPGITINFTANDPTCVTASAATIPTGLVSTTAGLTYGGSATLPCTTKLFATATNLQPDSVTVTVNPVPTISVGQVTVGSGLQVNTSFTLGAANHGNINVQLTSGDPGVLLAPDAVTPGAAQITIPVADGTQTVGFYVQGLEGRTSDTVRATVTVTAPGFANGTAVETSQQAAIDLQGIPATTTTLSPSSFAFARVGIANSNNTALSQLQAVRAGAPGPLTVSFTTPPDGVGQLLKKATAPGVTQTATIAIGQSNSPTDTTSGGVAFRPLISGSTTVAAAVSGFIATNAAARPISVSQPGITVGQVTVGSGLQVNTSFTLGAPNHGNISVQLSSADPGVLLSPDNVTAGQQTISIPVLDGVQTVGFYVQGLEGRTTDTIRAVVTVSAPGFANGTAVETSQQAAIDLQGIPATTTTLSPSSFAFARVGIANSNNTALSQLQAVRAGAPSALTVTFTIPPDGTGELLKKATAPGVTQTAAIASGQSNSPTDTSTGGVAFHPLQSGSTTVTAAIAGFVATNAAARPISVSQPGITVGQVTVGSGLQVNTSFTLGAPNHGNINVTLTSDNAGLLLAPNATTAGQTQITIPVADGVQTVGFYVQGLEGRTTDTVRATVTVSAPGFSNGTALETSQQAAIDLQGLPGTTTTLSPMSFVYARTGIANSGNTALNQLQAVRAGAPGPLTVTFTTPSNGLAELLTPGAPNGVSQTATIPIGQSNSPTDTTTGGVAFHALLSGTTAVAATIPGYIATTAATRSIDVSQPGITVGSVTVGSGLQINTSFTLGAPNHGAITVTVTSSNAAALVSPDAVTAGANQITIPVANGVQTVGFYVQGNEGQTGTPTITVTASGFTNGTGTATVVQPALDLQGLPAQTTPLTPSNFIYARVGVPNGQNSALNQLQAVRAGAPGALTVTFSTPANGIGELLKKGSPAGASQTATIPIGQSNSPTDTTSGGVAFHPLTVLGPTTVSATIPAYVATTAASRTITNQTPTITVGSVTVGSGLQINTSFTLGAPNHGNFSVTLTSDNAAVLLAPDAVTAGQTQITIPVADGVQTVGFYVQGLEGLSSGVGGNVMVSATGFSDGVAAENVVQAALDLQGVPATMAVGAPDASIYVRLGTPNVNNLALTQLQAVRAGLPGGFMTVSFTSDNTAAATLLNSSGGTGSPQIVQILSGQSNTPTSVGSGGVAVRRVAAGVASISGSVSGLITTAAGTRSVTVQ